MNTKNNDFDNIETKDFVRICIAAAIFFVCICTFMWGANMADHAVSQGQSETGILIIDASGIVGTACVIYLRHKLM